MAPPFVVLSAWLCGQAFAHGNGGYNTVGRGFGQGWQEPGKRLGHGGDGKQCLQGRGKSEIRAESDGFCIDFFTRRFENLPVVRKILFVQYLGAAALPQNPTGIKKPARRLVLVTAKADQPRGLPRPRPAGLSASGLPGRLRISLGRSATVLPRLLLRGASSRG